MAAPHPRPPHPDVPRSPRGVVAFCLLAYLLAWAVASPMWLSGEGLDHPYQRPLLQAMMFTPALAALVVLLAAGHRRDMLRVSAITPLRPARRILRYCAYGLLVPLPIMGGGVLLAAATGHFQPDLTDFSGFRQLTAPMGLTDPEGHGAPVAALVLFAGMQLVSLVLSIPLLLGEEWGWRGYLLPALLPLGTWSALLVHGAIWGAWHAPAVLLGYNFGRTDLVGLGMMTAWAVLLGVIIGWLRLASGSVWPAVVAHGAINVSSAWPIVLGDARSGTAEVDALPMGVWVGSGVFLVALVAVASLVPSVRSALPARPTADAQKEKSEARAS